MLRLFPALALATLFVAGCTGSSTPTPLSSSPTPVTGSPTPPSRSPSTPTSSAPDSPSPINEGRISTIKASCPFASRSFVMNTVGQRLDKTTVQKASGRTVGCRFYGLQHPTADCPEVSCLKPEDLPGPNQPAVEIDTTRYRSAAQARAAFIAGVQGVRSPERQSVGGIAVLCYETDFYAKDHGTDSGCAAAKGTVVLLVRTVSPASVGGLGIAFSVTDKVLSAL